MARNGRAPSAAVFARRSPAVYLKKKSFTAENSISGPASSLSRQRLREPPIVDDGHAVAEHERNSLRILMGSREATSWIEFHILRVIPGDVPH